MTQRSTATAVIEVKYLSMNHTHLQVEFTDESDFLGEAWIPLDAIQSEFNILDDIMDLEVETWALDAEDIPHG